MTPLVVDASITIKWFVPEVHSAEATRFLTGPYELSAPDFLLSEAANVLWRKVRRGELDETDAMEVLTDVAESPTDFQPSAPLVERALRIAIATDRTVYDSLYLALALQLGCQLVTADRRLYNAPQGGPLASTLIWVEDVPS